MNIRIIIYLRMDNATFEELLEILSPIIHCNKGSNFIYSTIIIKTKSWFQFRVFLSVL